jgi:hypothetical protein
MIERDLCRNVINKHVGRVRQMFRWAVENDYVSITPLRLDLTSEEGLAEVRRRAPLDWVPLQ